MVIPSAGGADFQFYVETSPNAAQRNGWAKAHVIVGWTEVAAYYPGLAKVGNGGSELAAIMDLAFTAAPTNTTADQMKVYFHSVRPQTVIRYSPRRAPTRWSSMVPWRWFQPTI